MSTSVLSALTLAPPAGILTVLTGLSAAISAVALLANSRAAVLREKRRTAGALIQAISTLPDLSENHWAAIRTLTDGVITESPADPHGATVAGGSTRAARPLPVLADVVQADDVSSPGPEAATVHVSEDLRQPSGRGLD